MTKITKDNGNRELEFDRKRLKNFINRTIGNVDQRFIDRVTRMIESRDTYSAKGITDLLIKSALEEISETSPEWTHKATNIYLQDLYKDASRNRSYDKDLLYGDFYGLQKTLATKGIYSKNILKKYSKEEIKEAGTYIVPERDKLFSYVGLYTLVDRYLAKDFEKNIYELPQERWLVIAMYLMQDEDKKNRMKYVEEAYWALSNLYMTVATPTLANSGKMHGQLSSCFILTTDDSLQSIYDDNTDVANLSKNGGGIGSRMCMPI